MNVRFSCPGCEAPVKVALPGPALWQCPRCDQRLPLNAPVEAARIAQCVVCGNHELYRKKDFPHALGMGILLVACVVSFVTHGYYQTWWTWAILIGTAAFDGLLYLWVGDVIVCYRCHAHYRGLPRNSAHAPFDLGIAERYRQERLRVGRIEAEQRSRGVR